MVIRQQQLAQLENASGKKFEDRMASHIERCFPEYAAQGPEKIRETIRNGIAAAEAYGFSAQRDVCHYIDLTIVFGPGFDRDPGLPWAREVLADRRFQDSSARMDELYGSAKRTRTA